MEYDDIMVHVQYYIHFDSIVTMMHVCVHDY